MATFGTLVLSVLATGTVYAFFKLARTAIQPLFSPLRHLPGPPSPSLIFGNFKQIWDAENSVLHERWIDQYGTTLKYKGLLNSDRLLTLDLKALGHIMMRTDIYQKPEFTRTELSRLLGEGVLIAEGEKHKAQRRILNPAFGPAQIRELTGIFVEKANMLRDKWLTLADEASIRPASAVDEKLVTANGVHIDALSWMSKATLDIIGLAGFSYPFNSLAASPHGSNDELNEAFAVMFRSGGGFPVLAFASRYFPFLRTVVRTERVRQVSYAQRTMRRIGMQLLQEKKAAVLASTTTGPDATGKKVGKKSVEGRDLLSLLVRANMAHDLPPSQRLSDEDVLAQIPTFLIAGHETTSTAATWALYALSLEPALQTRLRTELRAHPLPAVPGGGALSQEELAELNTLPLLDAIVRETLRLHAPVPSTIREAVCDDVIPLAAPFVGRDGVVRDSIQVSKGDPVFIPILMINRSKALWGEDAHEFKPDRWLNPPTAASAIPGMWSNLLTFIGGPHSCIGYRFSIIEMKVLLHVLLSAFAFELAVPKEHIIRKTSIVQRPLVSTEKEKGNQMPLLVTPVERVSEGAE